MRDLEYQVVKLSYVEVDRALAILKTVGYTVVEFKSGKGELAGEYSFTPSVSSTLSIKEFPKKDVLPIIIKVPDTETVSLLTQEKGKSAKGKKTELGLDLAGIPMLGATAGAPQQQILIGYNPNDFEPVARLLDLLSNKIDIPAAQIQIDAGWPAGEDPGGPANPHSKDYQHTDRRFQISRLHPCRYRSESQAKGE